MKSVRIAALILVSIVSAASLSACGSPSSIPQPAYATRSTGPVLRAPVAP